jgi:hypothetical protein
VWIRIVLQVKVIDMDRFKGALNVCGIPFSAGVFIEFFSLHLYGSIPGRNLVPFACKGSDYASYFLERWQTGYG